MIARKDIKERSRRSPAGFSPHRRRTACRRASDVWTFLYDSWNLVEERISYTNGTTSTIHYYWGKDISGSLQGAGGVGGLLYLKRNGTIYIPHRDANGNIVRYTDTAGNVVSSYTYGAFVNTLSATGTLADVFHFRYSTKYYDSETGLYYYGYRFYSPVLRRWVNRDPIEEDGGENLSMFVFNNPMSQFDADGRVVMPITITPSDSYVTAQGSQTPTFLDQIGSGTGPFHEEKWFEANYSGWINAAKSFFITEINKGIDCKNAQLNIKSSRQSVDPGIAGYIPWEMNFSRISRQLLLLKITRKGTP